MADSEPAQTSDVPSDALEPEPRHRVASRGGGGVEARGDYLLLVGGCGLVVLACVFRGSPPIAPVFGVLGPILFVLGAFYARIEGPIEATKDGVRLVVRATTSRARELRFPDDLTEEAVDRAIDEVRFSSRKPAEIRRAAESTADEVVKALAQEPRAKAWAVATAFAGWLDTDGGFGIFQHQGSPSGQRRTMIAERADEVLLVRVKVPRDSEPLDVDQVRALVDWEPPKRFSDRKVRRALVVPSDATLTELALDEAKRANIEVYKVSPDGRVQRVL